MTMTDPIADMLTRIRNAIIARHRKVDMPASKQKAGIAAVLKSEGYIEGFEVVADGVQGTLRLALKYDEDGVAAITSIERESKPGCRVYRASDELPKIRNGLGTAIVSTPKGILSDRQARKERVGGELICSVY